jgi:hypothetical protein
VPGRMRYPSVNEWMKEKQRGYDNYKSKSARNPEADAAAANVGSA